MAHKDHHNKGEAVYGSVTGSRGAAYFVTTDGAGVISCTCSAWRFLTQSIEKRVCKHLAAVFNGSLKLVAPAGAPVSTKAKVEQVAKTRKLGGDL